MGEQKQNNKLADPVHESAGHPYDQHYYRNYRTACGPIHYDREHGEWLEFFGSIADGLVAEIWPKKVLDVGCAKGFLVEAFRDRGVEAFGIDISEYAISEVRPDIRPYCRVASAVDPFGDQYDLITCIEVVEHLTEDEGEQLIANICANAKDIIFSSTPDDFKEPTHVNVQSQSYWIRKFLENGFYWDLSFDASFIAPQAMRFRKVKEGGSSLRNLLVPVGSRRWRIYWALCRVLEVLKQEGPRSCKRKSLRIIRQAITGQGLPVRITPSDLNQYIEVQYQAWLKKHRRTRQDLHNMKAEVGTFRYTPLISIITPVYNTDEYWLRRAIESVRRQIYPHWELCLANDASTKPHVRKVLDEYAWSDPRIKVKHLVQNEGIGGASNQALGLATGEFVGLLDHDDELSQDALFEVAKRLNEESGLDFLYSDEDKLELDGRRVEPFFKLDWSPDLLLSMNYITHFSVFRKSILMEIGGFRSGFDGSQDYDLILRFTEKTNKIAHIPKVLYHWRKTPGSAAASVSAKPYAYEAGRRVLEDMVHRRNYEAEVESISHGIYRVRFRSRSDPISINNERILLQNHGIFRSKFWERLGHDPEIATVLYSQQFEHLVCLGRVQAEAGRFKESRVSLSEASRSLRILRERLEGHVHDFATTHFLYHSLVGHYSNLGKIQVRAGCAAEARACFREAIRLSLWHRTNAKMFVRSLLRLVRSYLPFRRRLSCPT